MQGFPDLLHIANQSRPNIFDLEIQTPDKLYERVVEVDEQVVLLLTEEANQRNGKDAASNMRWAQIRVTRKLINGGRSFLLSSPENVLRTALASSSLCRNCWVAAWRLGEFLPPVGYLYHTRWYWLWRLCA